MRSSILLCYCKSHSSQQKSKSQLIFLRKWKDKCINELDRIHMTMRYYFLVTFNLTTNEISVAPPASSDCKKIVYNYVHEVTLMQLKLY